MSNKPTAKERIQALEEQIDGLHTSNISLATNAENLRLALLEVSEKLNAMVALSEAGQPVSMQNVDDQRKNNNIQAMKETVAALLNQGAITTTEAVSNRSFVIISETEKATGNLVQPRLQMSIMAMPAEVQLDFIGKKVGDSIDKGEFVIEIMELYDITELEDESKQA